MLKLFPVLALAIGLTIAVPVHNIHPRRLDPSQPDEIEDFELSKDEDPESIVIDAASTEEGDEFPDSPPPSEYDSEEGDEDDQFSQRQESRLERLSANYEQLAGQESQIYANLHLSEANQAEMQSNIKENEADARDLERFSDWLAAEAEDQREFAEELKENGATQDAENEARIGDILDEMSAIAYSDAELERDAVATGEKQVELESNIRQAQQDEVQQKSEQSELQLDQIYLEHHMIHNENRFRQLHRELFNVENTDDDESGGFIGAEDWEDAEEPQEPEAEDETAPTAAEAAGEEPEPVAQV